MVRWHVCEFCDETTLTLWGGRSGWPLVSNEICLKTVLNSEVILPKQDQR